MRFHPISVALLLLSLGACTGEIYQEGAPFDPTCDDGHCNISILASNRRSHATKIRDSAAQTGMTNAALLAGIGEVETNLTHCWSEATWACKGPVSPSCGNRPVIAGSADGACSRKQGGLGMFQFDRGTHSQTVSHYGSQIVTLEGNVEAVIPFLLVRAVESVPGINSQSQALAWMNSIRIADGDSQYEAWLRFVSWRFNGCKGCSSQENKYRAATHKLVREMGTDFWSVGSSSPEPEPNPDRGDEGPGPFPEPEPEPEPTFGSCNVSGQAGTCIDTGISSCGGQLHTGYCSGGSAIRCCVESGGTDFGVCNAFGNPG
ncbi:MAG: hypothetical protein JKY56_24825, partial [Kofleriaceae bacterium]|nr:hypothetical protein [Kofleriaceae bacterium]